MADLKSKQIKFPLTGTSVVSSSAQIATDISGSFNAASSSFSTRVTTAETELGNTLLSSSAQIATDISGSFVADSGSFSTRITTAESELGNTILSSSAQIATDISGSFVAPSASFSTRVTTAETELGNTLFSSSAQVDHDSTTNFVANEHINHTSVDITAGAGLTGGGDISSTRTLAVGAGTGVTVNADDVAIGQAVATTSKPLFAAISASGDVSASASGSFLNIFATNNVKGTNVYGNLIGTVGTATQGTIDHDSLANFVADEHVAHGDVSVIAGTGLTGGGTIASNRTLNVIGGTGVTANADDIAIGQDVATTANVTFASVTTTGNIEAEGDVIARNYIVSSSVTHMTSSIMSGSTRFGDTPADDTHQFTGSLFVTGSSFNIDSIGSVSSSNSGSFLNVFATNNMKATNVYGNLVGTVGTATQGTIDHDSLANFVANEHIDHSGVTITAGDGLSGGGTIASTRTLAVEAAQTTITSIFAADLKIGEDDQTKIDFEDENQINFYGNNVKLLELSNANTGDAVFNVATADKNFTIKGTDGSTAITALDIDMAAAGNAQFNANISGSQIEASGDVIAFGSSDKRLKDNITPIENPLEKMDKIGGYTFDWNEKQDTYKGHDVGVIAQEIEEILPEVVTTRGTGYKAVKYEKIVPLLIESIKELQKKVQQIEQNCDCLNK